MALTSRERVLRIINHEEADRVPIDLGGRVSSMGKGIYARIKRCFNIHSNKETIKTTVLKPYHITEALQREKRDLHRPI